jgi:hypothetical protein
VPPGAFHETVSGISARAVEGDAADRGLWRSRSDTERRVRATPGAGSDTKDGAQHGSARRPILAAPPARGGGRRGDQCRRTGRDRPEWLYGRLGRCLLGFGQKGSNRQVDMTANDSGRLPPVLAGAIVMTLRLVLGDSPPRVSTPQLTGNRTRWHPGEHHHDQQRPCAQHRSNSRCKPDASTGRRAIFQLKCASIQDLWDASGTFPHLRGESPSGPCPQVEPTRNEIMSEA